MSERELRNFLLTMDRAIEINETVAEVRDLILAEDLDVVEAVRDLMKTHDNCVSGHDRAVILSLADRIQRRFGFRLTPDGWEYTDETNPD